MPRGDQNEAAIGRRAVAAFAAIAALPVVLLADLLLAFARGWWSSSSVHLAVAGGSIAVLGLGVAGLATTRGRRALAGRLPAIVLGLSTLVGTWLLAELAVGILLGPRLAFHLDAPGSHRRFTPSSELMPGVSGEAFHTANSRGIRGPELPPRDAAYRILCIGGSTTACLYLDDEEAWPRLLMHRLNAAGPTPAAPAPAAPARPVWVGDVGVSGYGTWHHVRLMENEALLGDVDCLVLLIGINDLMRTLGGGRVFSPFDVKPCWERSNIFTVLDNVYHVHRQTRRQLSEEPDGSSYVARRVQYRDGPVGERLPDLSQGLAGYRTNIRTIIAQCRAHGVRPVFCSQPMVWSPSISERTRRLLWLGYQAGTSFAVPALEDGMRRFNEALRDECRRAGVECIDASALCGVERYFYDDCHYTEAGSDALAAVLARWFLDRGF